MIKQSYTKGELARAYSPGLTPKAALNRLMLWVNSNKLLCQALSRACYCSTQKRLTCRQVSLIFRYLGEPDD